MASDYADDEPDEPHDLDDRPGYAFTVAARPASDHGSVHIIDLSDTDWANLIPAALEADTVADFERLPFPAGIPDVARRAVAVWCRHPINGNGMLNWQGTYVIDGSGTHPATEDNPGDQLAYELLGGGGPWYPQHEYPDRPVNAIVTAMRAVASGVDPYSIDTVADWWPDRIIIDRRTPDGRPWVDIYDRNGRPICHTRLGHSCDRTAPRYAAPPEPPTTSRGQPLTTIETGDTIAAVVEAMRRRKTPGGRPAGHPPATSTVIASLTPRERLNAACEAVEQYGTAQAATARALDVRPDSLSRALKRRKRQRP